jgi:hypothetical protein
VHNLNIWRGDVRPDEDIWIGPIIEASFELCALEKPYIAILKFHDCESIRMEEFNHQNAVYDLKFKYEARGTYTDGEQLPLGHALVLIREQEGYLTYGKHEVFSDT